MSGEREETDIAGRNTARRSARDVTAPQEDVRNPATDHPERAIELSRLVV